MLQLTTMTTSSMWWHGRHALRRAKPGCRKHGRAVESGPMIRRLFTAAPVLSLLLFVGCCVLWPATKHTDYYVKWASPSATSDLYVSAAAGTVQIERETYGSLAATDPDPHDSGFGAHAMHFDTLEANWETHWQHVTNHAGVVYATNDYPNAYHAQYLIVPIWWLLIGLSLPPLVWLWRYRSRRDRIKRGLCLACGYDLRASTDRCPECGKPIIAMS